MNAVNYDISDMNYDSFVSYLDKIREGPYIIRFSYQRKDGVVKVYEAELYKVEDDFIWARKVSESPPEGIRKFFIDMIEDLEITDEVFSPIWDLEF